MRQYYASDRKKREQAKKRKQEEKKMKRLAVKSAKAANAQAGNTPVNSENPQGDLEQISREKAQERLVGSSSSEMTTEKNENEKD